MVPGTGEAGVMDGQIHEVNGLFLWIVEAREVVGHAPVPWGAHASRCCSDYAAIQSHAK
jgi:hypothetical protein